MKTDDLIDALGGLDDETVLAAREAPSGRRCAQSRLRVPRGMLIAAVLISLLTLGAAAYAIVHANSVRLMEAGPISGGKQSVQIDESAAQVIDSQSVDYGISRTDHGATVTLESVMGYSAADHSLLYLTLTVQPPAGTALPEDLTDCGFENEYISFPFDVPKETPWDIPSHGGANAAVRNPDGSVSVMLMRFFGGPVEGARMRLTLENFSITGKSAAEAALARQEQEKITGQAQAEPAPLVKGVWSFDLGRLHLPEQQTLTVDQTGLQAAGLPYHSLELTSFGARIRTADNAPTWLERLREAYPEELREYMPGVDWDNLTEEEFRALYEQAGLLVDPDDERNWLPIMLGWLEPWDYGCPSRFCLEYPDGTVYTVEAPGQIWQADQSEGEITFQILFPAPQPISDASVIVIDGTRIPLK